MTNEIENGGKLGMNMRTQRKWRSHHKRMLRTKYARFLEDSILVILKVFNGKN